MTARNHSSTARLSSRRSHAQTGYSLDAKMRSYFWTTPWSVCYMCYNLQGKGCTYASVAF